MRLDLLFPATLGTIGPALLLVSLRPAAVSVSVPMPAVWPAAISPEGNHVTEDRSICALVLVMPAMSAASSTWTGASG